MLSWLFKSTKPPLLANDADYVILEKLKFIEEQVGTHNNQIFHLQIENKQLHQEIKRLKQSNRFLYNQLEHTQNLLDRSIVLEPSNNIFNQKFIEK